MTSPGSVPSDPCPRCRGKGEAFDPVVNGGRGAWDVCRACDGIGISPDCVPVPVDPPTGQWTVDDERWPVWASLNGTWQLGDGDLQSAWGVDVDEEEAAQAALVRLVAGQATLAPEPTAEQVRTLIDAVLAWIDAPQGVPKLDAYYPLVDAAEDVRAALTGEADRDG